MAALGIGAGAFAGDMEREKLNLQRQQMNINAHNQAVAADQRQQQIDMSARQQAVNERNQDIAYAQRQQQLDMSADKMNHDMTWDDIIKQRQVEASDQAYAMNKQKLDALISAGDEEDRQRESLKKARESSLGRIIIAGTINGQGNRDAAFLKTSQLNMYNQENNTRYDAAGKINPITRKPYEDKLWHLVEFERNKDGQIIVGPDGMPRVVRDEPIPSETENLALVGEFGTRVMKEITGGNGSYRNTIDYVNSQRQHEKDLVTMKNQQSQDNRMQIEKMRAESKREVQNELTKRLTGSMKQRMIKDFMGSPNFMDADSAAKKADELIGGWMSDSMSEGGAQEEQPKTAPRQAQTEQPATVRETAPAAPKPQASPRQTPSQSGDNGASQKKVKGYRWNKDRTKRIPVYEDGSQGPVEVVGK